MFDKVQAAVEELPHQRLHGISTGEWGKITDLFGMVDLPGATQIQPPPTLADWQDTIEEKSGFKLQLKLDGRNRQFREALLTKPDGNDNDYFSDLLGLEDEDPSGSFLRKSLRRRGPLRRLPVEIFTCLTVAIVRPTYTVGLLIRGTAFSQNCTETLLLNLFAGALCQNRRRTQIKTAPDIRF